MNKIFKVVIFILVSGNCFAQQEVEEDTMLSADYTPLLRFNSLTIDLSGLFASNFITKEILFQNFWSSEVIDNQVDRLNERNYGGFELQSDVYLNLNKHIQGKERYTPWIGGHNLILGGASASEDLVKLVLQGNKENRNVSFNKNGFETEAQGYSQLSFGLLRDGNSNKLKFGVGILMGHAFASGKVYEGTLTTNEQGDVVSANDLDFKYWQANGNANKGMGAAFRVDFTKYLNINNDNEYANMIQIKLSDLGFIRWNEVTSYETRTKSFNFEGFDVTGFWDQDYVFDYEDSLESNYVTKQEQSRAVVTPFLLQAKYHHHFYNNTYLAGGVKYRYVSGFLPLVTATFGKYVNATINSAEIGIDAGGFGIAALHLGTKINLSSKLKLSVEITGVESLAVKSLPPFWMSKFGLGFFF